MGNSPENQTPQKRPNLFLELLFSEGGFSVLVILPLILFYYLSLAI